MEQLVEQAKSGDREAFEKLIMLLEKDLYRIAKLRLNNKEDIFDAVQETIIIAFQSIHKLRQPKYFKTWLIKILINQSNSIYKQKKRKKIISFEEIKETDEMNTSNIEIIEDKIDFNFICKDLKHEDKMIIVLYYKEKFTDKEIGKILNLKESTVATKRTRAKQKIKTLYETGGKKEWKIK